MIKDKACGNNPHSEDNVGGKKIHSGYSVLTSTSSRGIAGRACVTVAPGGRVQGLAKWWEK
jgi:hypothetical protein